MNIQELIRAAFTSQNLEFDERYFKQQIIPPSITPPIPNGEGLVQARQPQVQTQMQLVEEPAKQNVNRAGTVTKPIFGLAGNNTLNKNMTNGNKVGQAIKTEGGLYNGNI